MKKNKDLKSDLADKEKTQVIEPAKTSEPVKHITPLKEHVYYWLQLIGFCFFSVYLGKYFTR